MYYTLGVVSSKIVRDRVNMFTEYRMTTLAHTKDGMALIMEGRRSRVWHIQQHSTLYIISI